MRMQDMKSLGAKAKKLLNELTHYFKCFVCCLMGWLMLSSPLGAQNLTLSCPHRDIPFKVELAQTPSTRAKGLMFRTQLAEDEGMLFSYPTPRAVSMWMKNTVLSLDMIFCTDEGKILAIQEKTTPLSHTIIGPVAGTTQVLEIGGGIVQKYGITNACVLTLGRE